MLRLLIAATTVALMSPPAFAQNVDSMRTAIALGSVLGSESACKLVDNQAAIRAYIEKNVPASDMNFNSTLNLMTGSTRVQIDEMNESAKTAHCYQTERVARANGFIK